MLQFNNKSVKSKTVSNNQNPVWQFSSQFYVGKDDESKILFQVYDDDIGKDDFLGECCVDIKDILDNGAYKKEQSYRLEKCKTGEIILSIKFIPKQNIYKKLGDKYGPIDITFINIGAYNFFPIMPKKDRSVYHTNPEEALSLARDLKSKKVIGMHWGTVILSLEPIMEPPERFKNNAEKFGFKKDDAIVFKIGQVTKLSEILN